MGIAIQSAGLREAWRGLRASLPVVLALLPVALAFGSHASQKGLSIPEVALMTALNFAAGSEFAVLSVWTTPPNILLIVAVTFLVNSRHLLMGAVLAPSISHLPRPEAYAALFFMCDESWAMSLADARRTATTGTSAGKSISVHCSMILTWSIPAMACGFA
jgi:branched chain amino acid efflux pump